MAGNVSHKTGVLPRTSQIQYSSSVYPFPASAYFAANCSHCDLQRLTQGQSQKGLGVLFPPKQQWLMNVGVEKPTPLVCKQNKFWQVIYTPGFPQGSDWGWNHLKFHSCLASPSVSYFPTSWLILFFPWSTFLISHLHTNPCLRFCFWEYSV